MLSSLQIKVALLLLLEQKISLIIVKVIVSIKDTGTGIDSEVLPKLFTKFVTKSPIAGGTGLGLFISKSIIEMHGGSIWAFNNDEKNKDDRGSTFTFSLPVKE